MGEEDVCAGFLLGDGLIFEKGLNDSATDGAGADYSNTYRHDFSFLGAGGGIFFVSAYCGGSMLDLHDAEGVAHGDGVAFVSEAAYESS